MKKTTRNILIMLAVLVVLGGAAAALLLTQPEEQEESSSSASSSVTEKVMEKSTRDVSVIKVENAGGSYQLTPIEEPETETSASSETVSYTHLTLPTILRVLLGKRKGRGLHGKGSGRL